MTICQRLFYSPRNPSMSTGLECPRTPLRCLHRGVTSARGLCRPERLHNDGIFWPHGCVTTNKAACTNQRKAAVLSCQSGYIMVVPLHVPTILQPYHQPPTTCANGDKESSTPNHHSFSPAASVPTIKLQQNTPTSYHAHQSDTQPPS